MMSIRVLAALTISSLGLLPRVAECAFTVTSWSLLTGATDSSGITPITAGVINNTVENPYQATHFASTSPSLTTEGRYDISWLQHNGSFHLESDIAIHGAERSASNSATIFFTTDVDILLSLSAIMNFSSRVGDEVAFNMGLSLRDDDGFPNEHFYSQNLSGGDFYFEEPASGTLAFAQDNILLTGGRPYRIALGTSASTHSFVTNPAPVSAVGTIEFSWRPAVPEPTAISLILFAAPNLLLRRPRRVCAGPRP